jgi:hypothetical protein
MRQNMRQSGWACFAAKYCRITGVCIAASSLIGFAIAEWPEYRTTAASVCWQRLTQPECLADGEC